MKNKNIIQVAYTVLILAVIIALSLSACGRNNDQPEADSSTQAEIAGPRPGDAVDTTTNDTLISDLIAPAPVLTFDRDQFAGETLTIYTLQGQRYIANLVQQYMAENPDVTVTFTQLRNIEYAMLHTRTQLAAGTAPILMDSRFVDFYNPRYARYLADWYPIMNVSPYFNEDDFFMNVFHAVAVNGRFLAYPLSFSYRTVTANSAITGLVENLEWYRDRHGGVTISQLIEMMNVRHIPGSDMFLARHFDVSVGVWDYLHNFFNLGTHHVDFDNQHFIDFINNSRELTSPDRVFGLDRLNLRTTIMLDASMSERYFFQFHDQNMLQYFVDFGENTFGEAFMFTAPTPIISEQGELITDILSAYVLNAQATPVQQAIALDFMLFIRSWSTISTVADGDIEIVFPRMMPVFRGIHNGLVSHYIDSNLFNRFGQWRNWIEVRGELYPEERNDIITRLTAFGDMPMISAQVPYEIRSIIFDELEGFHRAFASAEDIAQNLQNRITVALSQME